MEFGEEEAVFVNRFFKMFIPDPVIPDVEM
jgi:hypothetical protein